MVRKDLRKVLKPPPLTNGEDLCEIEVKSKADLETAWQSVDGVP